MIEIYGSSFSRQKMLFLFPNKFPKKYALLYMGWRSSGVEWFFCIDYDLTPSTSVLNTEHAGTKEDGSYYHSRGIKIERDHFSYITYLKHATELMQQLMKTDNHYNLCDMAFTELLLELGRIEDV